MRFAIHGATGAQGRQVASGLAAAGDDVLALSRSGTTPGLPSLSVGAEAVRFPRPPRSVAAWVGDLGLQAVS